MRALLDLVLPVDCASCGERGEVVCPACRAPLAGPAQPAWPRPSPARLPPPYAVASYQGSVRDLLAAYKERSVVALRPWLAAALGSAVLAASGGRPCLIVPVPASAAARRARDGDVVSALARVTAGRLRAHGLPTRVVPALRHVRPVADSTTLGAQARAANLRGAFALSRRGAGVHADAVVLVDDVITTGATLRECADVLSAAGAHVVGAATIAATQRRIG